MKNLIWTLMFFVVILSTGCKKDNGIVDTQPEYNPDNWYWVKGLSSAGITTCYKILADGSGNIYITGSFTDKLSFGGTVLTSNGSNDIFVAKINSSGGLVWIKQAGGRGDDGAWGLSLDRTGNVLVAGSFSETINFDNNKLSSLGGYDVFFAQYDKSGNLIWVKQLGGNGDDYCNTVCTDPSGNLYVAGCFSGTANFGDTRFTCMGLRDVFIAKYNSSGALLWVKQAGGTTSMVVVDMVAENNGNILFCGYFKGTVAFGNTNFTARGDCDSYVSKMNGSGDFQWTKSMGGVGTDGLNSIAVDKEGNSYVTGCFYRTFAVDFFNLTSNGAADIVVVKLNSDGNSLWAVQKGGSGEDVGRGIALDSRGNCIVSGVFQGSVLFDGIARQSVGKYDAFLLKMSSSGQVKGISQMGGPEDDQAISTYIDSYGYSHVCGHFTGSLSFGSFITESVTPKAVFSLSGSGTQSGFFGKLVINN